jgi:hypothetical protein
MRRITKSHFEKLLLNKNLFSLIILIIGILL